MIETAGAHINKYVFRLTIDRLSNRMGMKIQSPNVKAFFDKLTVRERR